MTDKNKPDFRVENHHSILILQPISPEANDWVDENIRTEETLTWAGGIVVEPRYIDAIVYGIQNAGMTVQ